MNRINKANLILAENLVEDIMDKFEACGIAAAITEILYLKNSGVSGIKNPVKR